MIIKAKDDTKGAIATLRKLLALEGLSARQRKEVTAEMERLRKRAEAQKQAACHIDIVLRESRNWAVIHGLRIEHKGRVAEIDHLLIGRFFDIFVIGSKNLNMQLRVDGNGEFQVRNGTGWRGIESPIEENRGHIIVLNQLIREEKLTPMRLGLTITPAFRNWILAPESCDIPHGPQEEAIVLKMDVFDCQLREFIRHATTTDDILSVAKVCSGGTIMDFACRLVGYHRPARHDFVERFGIALPDDPAVVAAECEATGRAGRRNLPQARRIAAKRATSRLSPARDAKGHRSA
jgi:hypothetical protein